MVVILIVSFLAMLSVPGIARVKRRARTAVVVSDFRTFAAAFDGYAQEFGTWPAETAAGVMPAGMSDRLNETAWLRPTPIGGKYNWENNQLHFGLRYRAAIAISGVGSVALPLDLAQFTDLENEMDDGNFFSGNLRIGANLNPLYIIQP